jgi:hypothetical protein
MFLNGVAFMALRATAPMSKGAGTLLIPRQTAPMPTLIRPVSRTGMPKLSEGPVEGERLKIGDAGNLE